MPIACLIVNVVGDKCYVHVVAEVVGDKCYVHVVTEIVGDKCYVHVQGDFLARGPKQLPVKPTCKYSTSLSIN
jgi:hypothetical protein